MRGATIALAACAALTACAHADRTPEAFKACRLLGFAPSTNQMLECVQMELASWQARDQARDARRAAAAAILGGMSAEWGQMAQPTFAPLPAAPLR